MAHLTDYLDGKAPKQRNKITRDAFLYLEPKEGSYKPDKYAQCESCMMFSGSKHETCGIHGKASKIKAEGSCGFYVNGEPDEMMHDHSMPLVTKKESGYVERRVRCENCAYGDSDELECGLYKLLNSFPNFKLDVNIKAKGCCNANTPKGDK